MKQILQKITNMLTDQKNLIMSLCKLSSDDIFLHTVSLLYFLFFYFFIKCMQPMTMTLSRRCVYAKLHVI